MARGHRLCRRPCPKVAHTFALGRPRPQFSDLGSTFAAQTIHYKRDAPKKLPKKALTTQRSILESFLENHSFDCMHVMLWGGSNFVSCRSKQCVAHTTCFVSFGAGEEVGSRVQVRVQNVKISNGIHPVQIIFTLYNPRKSCAVKTIHAHTCISCTSK